MMRKLLMVLAGAAWFVFLFLATFVMTFPSDAVIERLRYEVSERSGGQYSLELSDLGPWWVGSSAQNVKLYQTVRSETTLAFLAKDVRASVSPWGLLMGAPVVSGSVTPLDGTLYYSLGWVRPEKKGDKRADLKLASVALDAEDFPLSELFLISGSEATATGGVDVHVDISSTEGLKDASGEISWVAQGLEISDVEIPGVGPMGFALPIDDLNLTFKVADGTATIQKGDIASPEFRAAMTGSLELRDTLERSGLNITIEVSELGERLSAFKMMLAQADVGGGKYMFTCGGTVDRPDCAMGEQRPSSSSRVRASRPTSRPVPGVEAPGEGDAVPVRPDNDELDRRREERLERLRQLREERMSERATPDEIPVFDADEGDEPVDDEDLPVEPEEEEVIIDEEFEEEEVFE
jgi:type II secretion system protein N